MSTFKLGPASSWFKGINFIGIIVGWLVDSGLTSCISITGGIVMVLLLRAMGEVDISPTALENSIPLILFGFIVGNGCTMVGGFVSGCIAKSHRVKNGLALWIFEYIRDFLDWLYPIHQSLWFRSLDEVKLLGCACFGAWIAKLLLGPGKTEPQSTPLPEPTQSTSS